jgi:hypothetical protein
LKTKEKKKSWVTKTKSVFFHSSRAMQCVYFFQEREREREREGVRRETQSFAFTFVSKPSAHSVICMCVV